MALNRNLQSFALITLLLTLLLAMGIKQLIAISAANASPPPLFSPEPSPALHPTVEEDIADVTMVGENPVVRQRHVTIYPDALTQPEMSLDLFADTSYVAIQENFVHADGNVTWEGRLRDEPMSEVVFALYNGALSGHVRLPSNALYQIRPAGSEMVIRQVEVNFVEDAHDHILPPTLHTLESVPAVPPTTPDKTLLADDGSEITVMVLYTSAVRASYGSTAAIEATIISTIVEANAGLTQSGIDFQYKVVFMGELGYIETGVIATDLANFQALEYDLSSQYSVGHVRNVYNADLVTLLIDKAQPGRCGVAYRMSAAAYSTAFAPYAYSVAVATCATTQYTLQHELAHNLGMTHDANNTNATSAELIYPFAYGYQDPKGAFHTIMAYSGGCQAPCPRVNYWASPNVFFTNGDPTGDEHADAQYTLNQSRFIGANFRQAIAPNTPTPTPSPTATATPTPTITPTPTNTPTPYPTIDPAIAKYVYLPLVARQVGEIPSPE